MREQGERDYYESVVRPLLGPDIDLRNEPLGQGEDGNDAFGFVMLDGPEGSLDNSFSTTHTFVSQKRDVARVVEVARTFFATAA